MFGRTGSSLGPPPRTPIPTLEEGSGSPGVSVTRGLNGEPPMPLRAQKESSDDPRTGVFRLSRHPPLSGTTGIWVAPLFTRSRVWGSTLRREWSPPPTTRDTSQSGARKSGAGAGRHRGPFLFPDSVRIRTERPDIPSHGSSWVLCGTPRRLYRAGLGRSNGTRSSRSLSWKRKDESDCENVGGCWRGSGRSRLPWWGSPSYVPVFRGFF